jgi:hypothetical protein
MHGNARRRFASDARFGDLRLTMTERRYSDDEVAAIFSRAAEGPQTPLLDATRDEGLTLGDLQEIGREVGIPADAVARAAQLVDLRGRAVFQTFLGLPSGVERTIALDRSLTEQEWENLVVELREVFAARGTLSSDGAFRQWTNGNLQALLEPTPTGHRLRLRTVQGSARASMASGLATLGVTAAVAIGAAAGGQFGHALPGIIFLGVLGLGMFGSGALRLPGWARLRRQQMDAIAARLASPGEPQPQVPPASSGN